MSDQTVITDDQKPTEPLKEKSIGQQVREKTFTQLLQEQRQSNQTKEETTPEIKPTEEEEKKTKEVADAKVREDQEKKDKETQEARVREQDEIAKRTADELATRQAAERKVQEDRKKAEDDEKARQEALKPAWQKDPNAPKDKDGNPLPRSYEELTTEAARIGEERALEKMRAEQAEKDAATKTQQEATQKQQQAEEARKKTFNDQLQKEIDDDLNGLWADKKLTKMKDPNDPNDPGVKEKNAFIKTAVEVNAKRMGEGKPPIRSLKLIYYESYLPNREKILQEINKQPAGGDAPVMGAESTQGHELPDDKYIPARDRKKSFAQIAREEMQRMAGKARIRN